MELVENSIYVLDAFTNATQDSPCGTVELLLSNRSPGDNVLRKGKEGWLIIIADQQSPPDPSSHWHIRTTPKVEIERMHQRCNYRTF
jgi:hypothetical protein